MKYIRFGLPPKNGKSKIYRGIKNIVHDKNNLIGIIQRDHLITYDGYKIPYRNGHFHYEEKTKIEQL